MDPIWYAILDEKKILDFGAKQTQLHVNDGLNIGDRIEPRYIATTNLMEAKQRGYTHMNAVGPGMTYVISLKGTAMIEGMITRSAFHEKDTERLLPTLYASYLYGRLLGSLSEQTSNATILVSELDHSSSASALVNCACDSVAEGKKRLMRETSALVDNDANSHAYFDEDEELAHLLQVFHQVGDFRDLTSVVRRQNFMAVVRDRIRLCSLARNRPASADPNGEVEYRILLSHESGLHPTPFNTWLQNYICGQLGCRILYPFADEDVQKAIYAATFPISFLNNAIGVLRAESTCLASSHHSIRKTKSFSFPKCSAVTCGTDAGTLLHSMY
jgi:hypothetical protein